MGGGRIAVDYYLSNPGPGDAIFGYNRAVGDHHGNDRSSRLRQKGTAAIAVPIPEGPSATEGDRATASNS